MTKRVHIIGAGLAGSECALQLAKRGVAVTLYEQRPTSSTPAHKTAYFAELVCSNSLKSLKEDTAAGTLKKELEILDSKLLKIARESSVPAGNALAVDREVFAQRVTEAIKNNPLIKIVQKEVQSLASLGETGELAVVATGPLTSQALLENLGAIFKGEKAAPLHFYDAAAPIVETDSLDREKVFAQSRYDSEREGEAQGDYLNAPMGKEEYERFVTALVHAEATIKKDFEAKDLFQACQPIEEVARTGIDSLRFGALKPVGLIDPRTGKRPYAAVQLRAENAYKQAYNLVGFQTNLTWPEQKRVFSMIPGLENAHFLRYGVMHKNAFLDSPHLLDETFALENPVNSKHSKMPKNTRNLGSSKSSKSTKNLGNFNGFRICEKFKSPPSFKNSESATSVKNSEITEEADTKRSIRFAGQITGTEGYTEAIASGLFAALNTYAELEGRNYFQLPKESVLGALFNYATNPQTKNYQPMHVNFGLVQPLSPHVKSRRERYAAFSKRAQEAIRKAREYRPDLF